MTSFQIAIKSAPADFHNLAQNDYGIGLLLLPDKVVSYIDSLAKKAAAFFKISYSILGCIFSFRSRFPMAYGLCRGMHYYCLL